MKKVYAAYHREENIRLASSSGGVFTELARRILKEGGVVFGAAFDEHFHVVYRGAEREEELAAFRGAKYVFPRIGAIYTQIREYLAEGKKVLFSGLPCHVEGLLKFLGGTRENLLCVDFICHGAPEESVWEAYLNEAKQTTGELVTVRMRDKTTGWLTYRVVLEGQNGCITQDAKENSYMKGFVRDYYLRNSCYGCTFRGIERNADITLGDYWGGGRKHLAMADNKGISLVLVHTEKGMELLEQAKSALVWEETDIDYAASQNPSLTQAAKRPEQREEILKKIQLGEDFSMVVSPYLKRGIREKLEEKGKRLLRLCRILQ